jgi:hypothetical protein
MSFLHFSALFGRELLYLDPGSGSMLLQLLLAALLGAGVLLRSQWNKLKSWFGAKKKDDEQDEDGN